jgi:hypothetical protein
MGVAALAAAALVAVPGSAAADGNGAQVAKNFFCGADMTLLGHPEISVIADKSQGNSTPSGNQETHCQGRIPAGTVPNTVNLDIGCVNEFGQVGTGRLVATKSGVVNVDCKYKK